MNIEDFVKTSSILMIITQKKKLIPILLMKTKKPTPLMPKNK